jgi:hypothetical protein
MTVRVGDGYPVRYRSVDSDRDLVAATLTLTVTDPSGNSAVVSTSNPSTGIYEATIDVDEAGFWQYQWVVTAPYDDVDDGQFTASSFVPPDYISLALFKANLKTTATTHEELMAFAIGTASRQVEDFCRRRFYADPTTTVRSYSPRDRTFPVSYGEKILVDDIASTTGLVVEVGRDSSWTAVTSYDTEPDNALADYKPITGLIRLNANWTTVASNRVRVTAKHGWPAVPQAVQQATLLQATRLYLRKDSPEGVMGTAEWGLIRMSRVDPDVAELLKDFVAYGFGATG